MQAQPYLIFEGRCEEAINFYRRAVGAEVTMLLRFKDAPAGPEQHPPDDKVMHANIRIGDTTVLLSDGRCSGRPSFQGFTLALIVANDAEATRYFAALAEGGADTAAVDQDILLLELRDAGRPLRRGLDGQRRAVRTLRDAGRCRTAPTIGPPGRIR